MQLILMAVILVHKHTASARLNDYLYYLKILNAISLVIMATLTNIYTHTHTHIHTHSQQSRLHAQHGAAKVSQTIQLPTKKIPLSIYCQLMSPNMQFNQCRTSIRPQTSQLASQLRHARRMIAYDVCMYVRMYKISGRKQRNKQVHLSLRAAGQREDRVLQKYSVNFIKTANCLRANRPTGCIIASDALRLSFHCLICTRSGMQYMQIDLQLAAALKYQLYIVTRVQVLHEMPRTLDIQLQNY